MKLSDRVEALAGDIGPFNPIREDIARAIGWRFVREGRPIGCVWYDPDGRARALPNWPASLDAAMTLVPEGWIVDLSIYVEEGAEALLRDDRVNQTRLSNQEGSAPTPALALCAAALRARGL